MGFNIEKLREKLHVQFNKITQKNNVSRRQMCHLNLRKSNTHSDALKALIISTYTCTNRYLGYQ